MSHASSIPWELLGYVLRTDPRDALDRPPELAPRKMQMNVTRQGMGAGPRVSTARYISLTCSWWTELGQPSRNLRSFAHRHQWTTLVT